MIKAKTIVIRKSPEQLFNFITDLNNSVKLVPEIIRAQKISQGIVGVGTKIEEVRKVGGKQVKTILEITKFDYPSRYSLQSKSDDIEVTYNYRIEKHEKGSKLIMTKKVTTKGIKRVLLPLVSLLMRKQEKAHLKKIKVEIEKLK